MPVEAARGGRRPRARPSTTPSTPRPSRFVKSSTAAPAPAPRRRSRGRSGARSRARARRPGAARSSRSPTATSTSVIRPRRDRAGLVEHDRVDAAGGLEHLRALDQQAELGAAAGADHQRDRRREAERAGAGDDQHGDGGGERERRALARCRARSRAWRRQSAITTGTKTPATRSASRCTGALPVWASVTSRAICASAVSAPTRVARTTQAPAGVDRRARDLVAGPTSTGTDSPVSRLMSTAERPSSTTPSVATFSPGRTRKPSPTFELLDRRSVRPSSERDLLGAELEQRLQRGAGAALGARLEVAAGEDERGDDRGGLEVDVVRALALLGDQVEAHRIPAMPASPKTARTATTATRRACRG